MNLEAFPIKSEKLTPQEFMNLSPLEKANIENSRIIPPVLGELDFGSIEVNYKDVIFHAKHSR
jgi:hypothetical protein